MNTLGEKLKMLRKRKGLNQQYLADMFQVTRGTISNWEINRRVPDLHTIEKLASFYGVSIDFFVPAQTKDNVRELLSRATEIFNSNDISQIEKDKLHKLLLKIYVIAQEVD